MNKRQAIIRPLDYYRTLPGATFPQVITDTASLPNAGGRGARRAFVYFLWHGDALIYIGATRNPRKRLIAHYRATKGTAPKAFDRATWWECPDKPTALRIERTITRVHEPEHNVKNTRRDVLSGRYQPCSGM